MQTSPESSLASSQRSADSLESLVTAMAAGNQSALSGLYEQTVSQIFGIARCMLRSREDAEEIVCDVYANAWANAKNYDPRRGSVMAWLGIMARNRSVDRLRQRRELLSLDDSDNEGLAGRLVSGTSGPDEILASFQSGSAVHAALASLSPLRRRLLGLAFFQDLSHQEIAAAEGIPLGTVKSHVRRALAVLQAALERDPQ